MAWKPIYHEPQANPRNLILSMSGAASSSAMRLEDQFTEALAWVLDRDPEFALRFVHLYVDGDPEALAALDSVTELGVSTQVRLPPLVATANHLRPDLSLTAPSRRFQLLVEVKVGADFGVGTFPSESGDYLDQVSAYVQAWSTKTDAAQEAEVRRVGTLTVSGDPPPTGPMRARDLRWADLAELIVAAPPAAAVAAVAEDLRALIVGMFGPIVAPLGFLEAGTTLTHSVAMHLSSRLADGKIKQVFKAQAHKGSAGGYLYFTPQTGHEERMWVAVTTAGSSFAEPGAPPSLWLCFNDEQPLHTVTRTALHQLGWRPAIDREGYRRFRIGLPIDADRLVDDLENVLPQARAWALGLFEEAGLARRADNSSPRELSLPARGGRHAPRSG